MTGGIDTRTRYLGFELAHPVVPSSSPLTGDIDQLHRLVAAGAPAVVLPSLFEEQVVHEALNLHRSLDQAAGASPEAPDGYFPELDDYNTGVGGYLQHLNRAKDELDIPVIASINGDSPGGWTLYARILEDNGADAIELNIYRIAADADLPGSSVESDHLHLIESVRKAVSVPLAVKVGPYYSSFGSFAHRMCAAGADALVLFNRFYQPDLDLDTLGLSPRLELSQPADGRLVMRWIGMLSGRVDAALAATTGVHGPDDAVKMVLAGADVTMMASGLLRNGPDHLATVVEGMYEWLAANDYRSVDQAKGSVSHVNVHDPSAYERANYMKTLMSYSPPWV